MTKFVTTLLFSLIAILPSKVKAGEPAAIVEEVTNADAGVQIFDSLESGHKIDMSSGGRIIIGYLQSCQRETITGGRITIGKIQSIVEGGSVKRERVECDSGRLILSEGQGAISLVTIEREPLSETYEGPAPELTIYGTSPFVSLDNPGKTILFKRLDKNAPPISVRTSGNYIDLAEIKISLESGATYKVTAGGKELIVKVDPLAEEGKIPLISRLILF